MASANYCPGPVGEDRCVRRSDSRMPNATVFCFECDPEFCELAARDAVLAALYRAQRRASRADARGDVVGNTPEHARLERFGPAPVPDITLVAQELKAACIELRLQHRASRVQAEA